MTVDKILLERADSKCELCSSTTDLDALQVTPQDKYVLTCKNCRDQITGSCDVNTNHWRCLSDSMWNQEAAVQVTAWRMLKRLSAEGWAQDLIDMLYLEPEVQEWAEAGASDTDDDDTAPCLDSNGTQLQDGDAITIIKDLVVKGAGFTAKRGTTVKNISLTPNPEHIEGRVNGTRIVLLSCYLKKLS